MQLSVLGVTDQKMVGAIADTLEYYFPMSKESCSCRLEPAGHLFPDIAETTNTRCFKVVPESSPDVDKWPTMFLCVCGYCCWCWIVETSLH